MNYHVYVHYENQEHWIKMAMCKQWIDARDIVGECFNSNETVECRIERYITLFTEKGAKHLLKSVQYYYKEEVGSYNFLM